MCGFLVKVAANTWELEVGLASSTLQNASYVTRDGKIRGHRTLRSADTSNIFATNQHVSYFIEIENGTNFPQPLTISETFKTMK